MDWLLHITSEASWQGDRDSAEAYTPPSLDNEGFIHCSTPQQIERVANALFSRQPQLLLLVIDPRRLQASVVYEDCYAAGEAFPHLYGPLNLDAVRERILWQPTTGGLFNTPPLPAIE